MRILNKLKKILISLTPLLALGAIIISICALVIDNVHFNQEFEAQAQQYQELTLPNIQHQQTLDMLNRLDARIQRSEDWVQSWSRLNKPVQNYLDNLSLVQTIINNAEKSWRDSDYTQAKDLINQANNLLDDIPQPPLVTTTTTPTPTGETNWWMWGGIIAAGIIIAAILWLLLSRRREGISS